MATNYRKDKVLVFGCYLSEADAKTVFDAVEKASERSGITNNRKQRIALIEISKHYLQTINNSDDSDK